MSSIGDSPLFKQNGTFTMVAVLIIPKRSLPEHMWRHRVEREPHNLENGGKAIKMGQW